MQKYVLGFAFYEGPERMNRVLLERKKKPEQHKGMLNGFGGKVEKVGDDNDEAPDVAMAREFREESGITTTSRQWRLFAILEYPDERVYCFKTTLPPDRLDKAHNDKPDIVYVASTHLPHDVVPDLRYLIPLAQTDDKAVVTFSEKQA